MIRYKFAKVYIDHYSNLSYVHLQETTQVEKFLKAKSRLSIMQQKKCPNKTLDKEKTKHPVLAPGKRVLIDSY